MAVDPREKRREGSRRAQAARTKRQEARRKRKDRNLMLVVGGVLAIVIAAASFAMFAGGGDALGREVPTQPATHISQAQVDAWNYNTSPPSSGPHLDRWNRSWGFQPGPLAVGEAVHNMEHGGVVIWYKPDDQGVLGAQVRDLVRELGSQCVIAGAYENMEWTVAATAWGRILEMETFDADQLREFVNAYRGKLGPEAPLCRTNP